MKRWMNKLTAEAAETVELEDLQEDNEPITGEEKRKLDAILRYTCHYFYGSRA